MNILYKDMVEYAYECKARQIPNISAAVFEEYKDLFNSHQERIELIGLASDASIVALSVDENPILH